jgi:C1A family cysteine protease
MNNTTQSRTYGWIPDLPDQRDRMFALPRLAQQLPPKVDLHKMCPPVYDQGQLGSCTANAIAGGIDFERQRQRLQFLTPSRLFIYYNERVIENSVATDSGAMLRDGMKSVAAQGVCTETLWPYDITTFQTKPSVTCYTAALGHKTLKYLRLTQDLASMKSCLAGGYPFVFGFTVYESFENADVATTGKVPMPGLSEQVLGGHAVLAVGYSDASQRFLARNSWGANWGVNGHFTIPYAYLTDSNLADDFWTIRTVA